MKIYNLKRNNEKYYGYIRDNYSDGMICSKADKYLNSFMINIIDDSYVSEGCCQLLARYWNSIHQRKVRDFEICIESILNKNYRSNLYNRFIVSYRKDNDEVFNKRERVIVTDLRTTKNILFEFKNGYLLVVKVNL